jgi:hypothetical protein
MQRKVPKSVGACYDMIEAQMLRGPWVTADAYTIADRLTHSGRQPNPDKSEIDGGGAVS